MIQEIKIRNIFSFRDEVTFSFEATNDKFAEDSQVVRINENTRLLRFAVVYGYNASGKSNLLNVFDFLRSFWFKKSEDIDNGTGIVPFKLDDVSQNKTSAIELVFYVGSTKYWYQLELDRHQVYLEKLSYYKSNQPTMLFERRLKEGQSVVTFNANAIKISNVARERINVSCLKNMSFFAARNQVNVSIPLIDVAGDWMKERVMPIISPSTNLLRYAQMKVSENEALSGWLVDFLHAADFNITNIKTSVVTKYIPDEFVSFLTDDDNMPKDERERIRMEKTVRQIQTYFEHTVEVDGETAVYRLGRSEQSAGTLRTFGIETALFDVLNGNAFLPIDEIETSMHPKLLEKVLYEYLKVPARSQLIVATHNDGLLDLTDDLIRKDAVWFTEKKRSGVTDLYKLTDFRGINRLSSIREAYRNKRFGATMGGLWEKEN